MNYLNYELAIRSAGSLKDIWRVSLAILSDPQLSIEETMQLYTLRLTYLRKFNFRVDDLRYTDIAQEI